VTATVRADCRRRKLRGSGTGYMTGESLRLRSHAWSSRKNSTNLGISSPSSKGRYRAPVALMGLCPKTPGYFLLIPFLQLVGFRPETYPA
jgi:hypothetical protein